jgi:hypothetical protein
MEINMANTIPEQNKALVLQAFDTLFNKRDYEAAARFWSDTYIQHSAHIEPGREGLFDLIRSAPDTLRYGVEGRVAPYHRHHLPPQARRGRARMDVEERRLPPRPVGIKASWTGLPIPAAIY